MENKEFTVFNASLLNIDETSKTLKVTSNSRVDEYTVYYSPTCDRFDWIIKGGNPPKVARFDKEWSAIKDALMTTLNKE